MEPKVLGTLVVFSIVGTVLCQISNSLDVNDYLGKQLKIDIGPAFDDLEKGMQENDLAGVSNLNDPKFHAEKVEQVFKEKCEKNGAGDAIESFKNEAENVKNCVTRYVNASIGEELEEAKKTGAMDEVFAKYCKKWPQIYKCTEKTTSILRRCLSDEEIVAFNRTLDIMQELQEFMCFKEGDRLAMFMAEGGPDCLMEQKEGIQNCLNATVGDKIPSTDDFSVATLPSFLFSQENCHDFDTIRVCVNGQLEKCKDTTPANIVDAFFKFLKKHLPCGDEEMLAPKAAATAEKGASGSAGAFANSFLVSLGISLLLKHY